MHNTLRFLATLAMLLNLKHHALHGAQGAEEKDYFIVELGKKEVGKHDGDGTPSPVQCSYHIVHRSMPNDALVEWIQGQGYTLRVLHAPYENLESYDYARYATSSQQQNEPPSTFQASFIEDNKDFSLASEKVVKAYIQDKKPRYWLTYSEAKVTNTELTDDMFTKPFHTLPKSDDPDAAKGQDSTLFYFVGGVVVVIGVACVLFRRTRATANENAK